MKKYLFLLLIIILCGCDKTETVFADTVSNKHFDTIKYKINQDVWHDGNYNVYILETVGWKHDKKNGSKMLYLEWDRGNENFIDSIKCLRYNQCRKIISNVKKLNKSYNCDKVYDIYTDTIILRKEGIHKDREQIGVIAITDSLIITGAAILDECGNVIWDTTFVNASIGIDTTAFLIDSGDDWNYPQINFIVTTTEFLSHYDDFGNEIFDGGDYDVFLEMIERKYNSTKLIEDTVSYSDFICIPKKDIAFDYMQGKIVPEMSGGRTIPKMHVLGNIFDCNSFEDTLRIFYEGEVLVKIVFP